MSVDRNGNITISDTLAHALVERRITRIIASDNGAVIWIMAVEGDLNGSTQTPQFLDTDTLADHARKLSEGQ